MRDGEDMGGGEETTCVKKRRSPKTSVGFRKFSITNPLVPVEKDHIRSKREGREKITLDALTQVGEEGGKNLP